MQNIDYQDAGKELRCVGDFIRWATSVFRQKHLFFGHGTDNAWDEAVQLVLQLLHLPMESDPLVFHSRLTTAERKGLVKAIQERVELRKPLPYITHQAWCAQMQFYVDENVLIPRSPLSEWIEKHFEPWIDADTVQSILEVGTGSGALAIIAALNFPDARVDAVDISDEALAVAKINVDHYGLQQQINLIHSDCFQALGDKCYDVILSNPPYVGAEEMTMLPKEYLHEPRIALEARDNGLKIVLELIAKANKHLNPEGILLVEVGNSQDALIQRLPQVPFVWLEQERGGQGIFLLTKKQIDEINW